MAAATEIWPHFHSFFFVDDPKWNVLFRLSQSNLFFFVRISQLIHFGWSKYGITQEIWWSLSYWLRCYSDYCEYLNLWHHMALVSTQLLYAEYRITLCIHCIYSLYIYIWRKKKRARFSLQNIPFDSSFCYENNNESFQTLDINFIEFFWSSTIQSNITFHDGNSMETIPINTSLRKYRMFHPHFHRHQKCYK